MQLNNNNNVEIHQSSIHPYINLSQIEKKCRVAWTVAIFLTSSILAVEG